VGETIGGGYEILRGDKTHYFISIRRSLQNKQKNNLNTRPLFLSSVSLLSFHTQ
jgi:hypothetical protein